jgi:ElaB/YqjD/DUF883 family membrane-anchored ribosome-binding protein
MSDAATPSNGAAPSRAGQTARKTVRKVKAEPRSFVDDAAETDDAREHRIAVAIHRARARRALVQGWAREKAVVAGEAVQTRPLTAIAAALGVGLIIGLLAAR